MVVVCKCLLQFVLDGTDLQEGERKQEEKFQAQTITIKKSPRRFNTKALLTLTVTQCLFTMLVFPVATLHFMLAISEASTETFDMFWLEILVSISFSSVYVIFPVMTALADKEIKRTIAKLVRRVCEDFEVQDDITASNHFGDERV